MSITLETVLTDQWNDIATAGEVHMSPESYVFWATTHDTTAPTVRGHPVSSHRGPLSAAMTLTGSERLWVKGEGRLSYNADAPV